MRCSLSEVLFVLFILSYTSLFVLGCDFDGCYRWCWHARRHHCVEQLLRLGPVCRGLPAQQQPADHRGRAHWLVWCYPVLHHVCGKKHMFERKGNGVLQISMCLSYLICSKNVYAVVILFSRNLWLNHLNKFARLLLKYSSIDN